jgi:hypothetical protein
MLSVTVLAFQKRLALRRLLYLASFLGFLVASVLTASIAGGAIWVNSLASFGSALVQFSNLVAHSSNSSRVPWLS